MVFEKRSNDSITIISDSGEQVILHPGEQAIISYRDGIRIWTYEDIINKENTCQEQQ